MFGIFLAALYAGWLNFHDKAPLATWYHSALGLLNSWYIICAVAVGILSLIAIGVVYGGLALGGLMRFGPIGGLVAGLGGGTVVTVLMLVAYFVKYGALIGGTLLLNAALTGAATWNLTYAILGGLLLVIGLSVGNKTTTTRTVYRNRR